MSTKAPVDLTTHANIADALGEALAADDALRAVRDIVMRLRGYPEAYFEIRARLEGMADGAEVTIKGARVTRADASDHGPRYNAEIGGVTHAAGAPTMAMLIEALAPATQEAP